MVHLVVSVFDNKKLEMTEWANKVSNPHSGFPLELDDGSLEISTGEFSESKSHRGKFSTDNLSYNYWMNSIRNGRIGRAPYGKDVYFASSRQPSDKVGFHIIGKYEDIIPYGLGSNILLMDRSNLDRRIVSEFRNILAEKVRDDILLPYKI